jgi:hypothetical protein
MLHLNLVNLKLNFMKQFFFVLFLTSFFFPALAQLKTTVNCKAFTVDVLEGTINDDLSVKSTLGEFKSTFPCYTSLVEENGGKTCGGVFYKNKGLSIITERGYFEIAQNFKGKLSLPLMGAARSATFKWLGNAKVKDATWDAFQTKYGIIILYYDKALKVNKIQMSRYSTDAIKLCE